MSGIEAIREREERYLSEWLGTSIANLGYPVGMGIAPHPDSLAKAGRALFDRMAKMAEMAARGERERCAEIVAEHVFDEHELAQATEYGRAVHETASAIMQAIQRGEVEKAA